MGIMELIDKDALAAKIENRIKETESMRSMVDPFWEGQISAFDSVLKILDTLEVKEVDLDRAIDKWICDDAITHEDCSISDVISTAKHFFELGIKMKGE